MNRDDLLKLLDLGSKEVSPKEPTLDLALVSSKATRASAHPTALDLDDWGLRRGQEVLDESDRLRQTGLDAFAVADFHGAAFEPEPVLQEGCVDPQRHDFLAQMLQTPDYHALHQSTMLDAVASAIAAAAFAEQFVALRKEKCRGDEQGHDREMAPLRAVGRAVREAAEEVEESKDACAALGMGPGSPGSNDPTTIAALFRRVRSSPVLRRICELAGRYRRVALSSQWSPARAVGPPDRKHG